MVARAARPRPDTPPASSEATRHVMQANRSKDTKPELKVRAALREAGLTGYRLHWKKAPGHPDVCFPGRRVAIFVHGCFWHRCPHCSPSRPKTHSAFWQDKFARNRARDARDSARLVEAGWTVVVVWECRLKGARLEPTMREVVAVVRAAGEGHLPARVIEVGSAPAWVLRMRRSRRKTRRS
ncbi:very short patch repair endonuclease [Thermophilibacter sp. ZX-H3]|uniref:very short patch repair endonuclease n=1 Tax=unclassified Thermophilibacter TaxID=2847308 RepID=UPI0040409115